MKAYLIEEETAEEAVQTLNETLAHFEGAPVSVTWKGDLTGCVILSNAEPESLYKAAKKPAAKAAAKKSKED